MFLQIKNFYPQRRIFHLQKKGGGMFKFNKKISPSYGGWFRWMGVVAFILLGGCQVLERGGPAALNEAIQQGYFFVGGRYIATAAGPLMERQMYVETWRPTHVTQPYPIVMIHGAAQTGTNFTGTPDGRMGWAEYFARRGYAVYVVDQPARGRSAYQEGMGKQIRFSAKQLAERFTATAKYNLWPQAQLHTQWPGEGPHRGEAGDEVFDQFYASQVPYIGANNVSELLIREAGAALLDKIGAAIILTHSQSGAFGWIIADARPHLVKAIVAAEPTGPPFENTVFGTTPARPWGITETPMAYVPAITDPKQLQVITEPKADGLDLAPCKLQGGVVHQLLGLQKKPILIFTSEASYHAVYDHCTAKYIHQAGGDVQFVRLPEVGIRGNGHMVMIEKNNLEIAAFVQRWVEKNVK